MAPSWAGSPKPVDSWQLVLGWFPGVGEARRMGQMGREGRGDHREPEQRGESQSQRPQTGRLGKGGRCLQGPGEPPGPACGVSGCSIHPGPWELKRFPHWVSVALESPPGASTSETAQVQRGTAKGSGREGPAGLVAAWGGG